MSEAVRLHVDRSNKPACDFALVTRDEGSAGLHIDGRHYSVLGKEGDLKWLRDCFPTQGGALTRSEVEGSLRAHNATNITWENAPKGALMDQAILQAVKDQDFSGAVMVIEGKTVHLCKGYGPGITPKSRFLIASLTKQFTGVAILRLVEEGKLKLDDPLEALLSEEVLDPAWKKITVRELLRHQTGIPSYGEDEADFSREVPFQPAEVLQAVKGKPLAFPSGAKHQYSNTNYFLLGMIIEAKTGKTYGDHLQETIFGPMGMTSTGYNPLIPDSELARGCIVEDGEEKKVFDHLGIHASKAFASGSLFSTVEDLYRWNLALSNPAFFTPWMHQEIFDVPPAPVFGEDSSQTYNAGFFVGKDEGLLDHAGRINGFNSFMIHFLKKDAFVVVLSNNDREIRDDLGRIGTLAPAISLDKIVPILQPE